jgi:hypothetical protein
MLKIKFIKQNLNEIENKIEQQNSNEIHQLKLKTKLKMNFKRN